MLSSVISYITYSQFWVVKNNNNIFIGGVTTRATFEFELEFSKLINKFKNYLLLIEVNLRRFSPV